MTEIVLSILLGASGGWFLKPDCPVVEIPKVAYKPNEDIYRTSKLKGKFLNSNICIDKESYRNLTNYQLLLQSELKICINSVDNFNKSFEDK